jgi:hypothetical protein
LVIPFTLLHQQFFYQYNLSQMVMGMFYDALDIAVEIPVFIFP